MHQVDELNDQSFYSQFSDQVLIKQNDVLKMMDSDDEISLQLDLGEIAQQQSDRSFLDADDSGILAFTQTQMQNTQEYEMLNETIRKQINTSLHNGIDSFVPKLYQDTNQKAKELSQLKVHLENFKPNSVSFARGARRNNRYNDVPNTNLPESLQFQIMDTNYNPFYISFNQTVIVITNVERNSASTVLDRIDTYLREVTKNGVYITPRILKSKEIVELVISFINDGVLQFIIKCDARKEKLQYQLLKSYVALSNTFKYVCSFLLYWAYKRRVIPDLMSEFAFQVVVINFFQINNIIPRIFEEKFCPWPLEKKKIKKEIDLKNAKKLVEDHFESDEYTLKKNRIIFHMFPRAEDAEFVEQKQSSKLQKRNTTNLNRSQSGSNYGNLVAQFFHWFNQNKGRRIDITNTSVHNAKNDEFIVIDPLDPLLCLTPNLMIRHGKLSEQYFSLMDEFQRAYECITKAEFKKLNEKRDLVHY